MRLIDTVASRARAARLLKLVVDTHMDGERARELLDRRGFQLGWQWKVHGKQLQVYCLNRCFDPERTARPPSIHTDTASRPADPPWHEDDWNRSFSPRPHH